MTQRRRGAKFGQVLVYLDEPQLITLVAGLQRILAIAIPSEDDDQLPFLAVTVSSKDWERYLDGTVDLRYLFTFPRKRNLYTFDMASAKNGKVMMTPFPRTVPNHYLPEPRFFSDNHTEEVEHGQKSAFMEELLIDGEWEMPDFGLFYVKYADVYSFVIALLNWSNPNISTDRKRKIIDAFQSYPFKGGGSYLHFYRSLMSLLRRDERLSLDNIQYASPGHVKIHGREDVFEGVTSMIGEYLEQRDLIKDNYARLYGYLKKNKLLRMPGTKFLEFGEHDEEILIYTKDLVGQINFPDLKLVMHLSDGNVLVSAKTVLSFYRRLDETADFFAQGRINFSENSFLAISDESES